MAYLSSADYITRFGATETKRLTNENPNAAGAVADTAKVDSAIRDVTEVVNGYIATRYATPLAAPPPLVIGWVAILAREQLYTNTQGGTPQTIVDAADRVRQQLRDLANDKLNIPGQAGIAPPATIGDASPISSQDRPCRVFTDQAMGSFLMPFGGGYGCAPAWRQGQ